VSGGRFTDHGEAAERALFARRTRALPAAEVPSLQAVLTAADAGGSVVSTSRVGRVSVIVVGVAALAAACVGGLVVGSVRAAGDGKGAATADFDAGVVATSAFGQAGGQTCEPDDEGVSSEAPPASIVLASSDPTSQTCVDPAPSTRPEPALLASEPELVCMP
jgi:hypothetical protein